MKKFVVLFLVAVVAAGVAFAQSSLTVNASIAQVLQAKFGEATTSTISFGELSGTGDKTTGVASLTVISNRPTWTITFSSPDGDDKGSLVPSAGSAAPIPYKLKAVLTTTGWANVGNVTNSISDFQAMSSDRTIVGASNSKTPVTGVVYALSAQLTMPSADEELYEAGVTFSDTITIAIAAN
jgi:hypothetical protein